MLAALGIALGLVGIVVPLLPGTLLVAVDVLGWAVVVGQVEGWAWAVVALVVLGLGVAVKYVVPGRRLTRSGVPRSTLVSGGVLAVVGFFVVPVVGLVLGFVAGVYLAEAQRVGGRAAWPSTRAALSAVGLALLLELGAGLVAATAWGIGALTT